MRKCSAHSAICYSFLVCVFQQGVQNINLGSRFRPHWLNSVRRRCQAVVAMAMLKTKDIPSMFTMSLLRRGEPSVKNRLCLCEGPEHNKQPTTTKNSPYSLFWFRHSYPTLCHWVDSFILVVMKSNVETCCYDSWSSFSEKPASADGVMGLQ